MERRHLKTTKSMTELKFDVNEIVKFSNGDTISPNALFHFDIYVVQNCKYIWQSWNQILNYLTLCRFLHCYHKDGNYEHLYIDTIQMLTMNIYIFLP